MPPALLGERKCVIHGFSWQLHLYYDWRRSRQRDGDVWCGLALNVRACWWNCCAHDVYSDVQPCWSRCVVAEHVWLSVVKPAARCWAWNRWLQGFVVRLGCRCQYRVIVRQWHAVIRRYDWLSRSSSSCRYCRHSTLHVAPKTVPLGIKLAVLCVIIIGLLRDLTHKTCASFQHNQYWGGFKSKKWLCFYYCYSNWLLHSNVIVCRASVDVWCLYDTIRYNSVYLTCSKKLTGSQLSLPHGTNKKLKCKTKNKMMSVIGPVQSRYREAGE